MNPATSDTVLGDLEVHWDDTVSQWAGVNGCTTENLFAAIVHVEGEGEELILTGDVAAWSRADWDPFYLALGPREPRRGLTMWLLLSEVLGDLDHLGPLL